MKYSARLSSAVFLGFVAGTLGAIGPVTDLVLVNKDIAPDGVRRAAVLAGGTFPGPLIVGKKGDDFSINIINKLTNESMLTGTSIHWHGFHQIGTNWADGTAQVTQCPISTGESFRYNFSSAGQAGTFWYHSHLQTQYCDGLRGAMVVYDPHDPHKHLYDVDDEHTVITLADWYHVEAQRTHLIATSDTTLINGKGRTANHTDVELSVIHVQHGKRYRFRLVNMACDPFYNFTIDAHSMTVIEADSENTKPLKVDSVQILSGQRYSVVVAANQPIGNYWIRAAPDRNTAGVDFTNGINSAILRYAGAPKKEPTSKPTISRKPLREVDLHPLTDPAAPGKHIPGEVEEPINLAFAFDFDTGTYLVNGKAFTPPPLPVLLQILHGGGDPFALLPAGSVIPLKRNSVVELSMPGGPIAALGGPHPFHLHGHAFSVVRSAGSDVFNFKNPVRRDVVSTGVGANDNVTIRFETNNPGPWFLHCHIDWHLQVGLALIFAEDVGRTSAANPVPQEWEDLCPIYADSSSSHTTVMPPFPLPSPPPPPPPVSSA